MSDFLLELSQNPNARKLIKTLGLPVPMPESLRRARGPWQERPLAGYAIAVGAAPGGELAELIAATLAPAGAEPRVVGEPELLARFLEPGEAFGRPPVAIEPDALGDTKLDGLVLDASGANSPAELRALYDFFHPLLPALGRSGRAVVLARPPAAGDKPAVAAAREALTGFTRSLAKEVGKKGATAQVVYVAPGAEERAEAVLRWVLSPRSAFLSGQPIYVDARAEAGAGAVPYQRVLDQKVALVTGAARGIGAATARLLAAEGAHVVCLDRPADDGPTSQIAREIGGSVLLADVTDPDAPELIARQLLEQHGGVDIVVHNAGVTRDKTLARMKASLWDQCIDINLAAVDTINRRLLDGVIRGGGRIICLSSIAGIAGNMGQTNYAASKAGLIGYVRALAPTVAGRGITVNAIAPGFIETRLTDAIPVMIREVGRRLSALGQGGKPGDIGEAITFLASPGASGLTGQIIRVCGGAFVGA